MQFPFNLNYYSKYNRAKDRKSIGSLLSLIPIIGPSQNEQGFLLNLGKQKDKFLVHDGKQNIENENEFQLKKSIKKEIIDRKIGQNELMKASNFSQEGSQSKQQEQPINMPRQKTNLCHFKARKSDIQFQEQQRLFPNEFKLFDQQSSIAKTTQNEQFLHVEQSHSLILQAPQEFESFQQDFTQVQSVVLDRLLIFQGYHQYSQFLEAREPEHLLDKIFQYKNSQKSQIPAIPLAQQVSLSQISKIQTQMNDFEEQQFPDIISRCNSVLDQDDFIQNQSSKPQQIMTEVEMHKRQSILASPLQDIVQSPVSLIEKTNQKRTNFKSILQRNKSTLHNDQFAKKKNKQLLAGFFEQN